ncbi:MAG: choice-of-anchor D domain-containing protein [Myxococcota bacterium]
MTWSTSTWSRALSLILLPGALALGACSDKKGSGGFEVGADLVLKVNPTAVTFGSVVIGRHAEQVVTLEHAGTTGVLHFRSVTLVTGTEEIAIEQPALDHLDPGQSTTMLVTYDPTDITADSGKVVIETNVPTQNGGTLTVEIPIQSVASAGLLVALPNPVDFGEVAGGEVAPKTVTLLNVGASDITIDRATVQGGQDEDFSLSFVPNLPTVLAPDDTVTLEVSYAPTTGDTDQGKLNVYFTVEGVAKEIDPPVLLLGREVGPHLVAFPNPMDFGARPLDMEVTQPLTLANQGSRDLVVSAIDWSPTSSDTVTVTGFPASGGSTIVPGGVLPLTVHFMPTPGMVQTTGPIATLVVTSNDTTDDGKTDINIFGRGEVPILQVNPPDVLDFAFVAQNLTRQKTLALYNAGTSPLTISSISLTDDGGGEYAIVKDESWGPLSSTPTSAVLAPASYKEVRVEFTNRGASSGTQWGKIVIGSNDGTKPNWEVQLKAQRTGAPTCEISLVPLPIDFGVVPRGFRRTMTVNLVNSGSGDCSFHSAFVNDCAGFFGFFSGACDDPNHTLQISGTSSYYKVTRTPLALQNGLKAGQSYPIDITFTPPDTAPITGDDFMDYAGLLSVRIVDPYSGSNDPVVYPKPLAGSSPYPPNIHAKSGLAKLAVLPSELDFGLTTIGCHSQTLDVTAYNVGTAPLDVTDIKLEGCSSEFKIKASPGLPLTLAANGSDKVSIVYVPQDRNADACGLGFYVAGEATPTIVVPLRGEGTFDTEQTDVYTQTTGQSVDVLFVVDDSGSMSEEQQNLAQNFQSFVAGAQTWNNDYHIAVVTTDLEGRTGNFFHGTNNPRFVTRQTVNQFQSNVNVGTNGSGTEQGLAAAQAALSLPNTAETTTACTTDTSCSAPEKCVDGFCGGPNRGFLREDAALEIVMVSDEEDQSPNDIAFYVNFFKTIKGFYNTNMMHVHAIVGDTPSGCSSNAGAADAGFRYIDVANQTGGAVGSICNPSFASALSSIGDIAFGLRTQFFLSRLPDPATITVSVAGASCSAASGANWRYDAPSNSVVFDENGGCMPNAGQEVKIHYQTICLLE